MNPRLGQSSPLSISRTCDPTTRAICRNSGWGSRATAKFIPGVPQSSPARHWRTGVAPHLSISPRKKVSGNAIIFKSPVYGALALPPVRWINCPRLCLYPGGPRSLQDRKSSHLRPLHSDIFYSAAKSWPKIDLMGQMKKSRKSALCYPMLNGINVFA